MKGTVSIVLEVVVGIHWTTVLICVEQARYGKDAMTRLQDG